MCRGIVQLQKGGSSRKTGIFSRRPPRQRMQSLNVCFGAVRAANSNSPRRRSGDYCAECCAQIPLTWLIFGGCSSQCPALKVIFSFRSLRASVFLRWFHTCHYAFLKVFAMAQAASHKLLSVSLAWTVFLRRAHKLECFA